MPMFSLYYLLNKNQLERGHGGGGYLNIKCSLCCRSLCRVDSCGELSTQIEWSVGTVGMDLCSRNWGFLAWIWSKSSLVKMFTEAPESIILLTCTVPMFYLGLRVSMVNMKSWPVSSAAVTCWICFFSDQHHLAEYPGFSQLWQVFTSRWTWTDSILVWKNTTTISACLLWLIAGIEWTTLFWTSVISFALIPSTKGMRCWVNTWTWRVAMIVDRVDAWHSSF